MTDAWVIYLVIILLAIALNRRRYSPDLLMLGSVVLLLATGILTPTQALAGFSNPYTFALGAWLLVSATVARSGWIEIFIQRVFETRRPPLTALARVAGLRTRQVGAIGRLALAIPLMTALLGEARVHQALSPWIRPMARRRGVALKMLILPLHYALRLGSLLTLPGARSSLLVAGLALAFGVEPLGLLELTPLALILTLLLMALTAFLGPLLWEAPQDSRGDGKAESKARRQPSHKDFVAEMVVQGDSPLVGRSVKSAGLRHLDGLYLFRIERGDEVILPVGPWVRLEADDHLFFAGSVQTIKNLQAFRGLEPIREGGGSARMDGHWAEAVISAASPLVGLSIRDVNFRARYQAAVIAVHRNGQALMGSISEQVLQGGDCLLLQGASGFAQTHRNSSDFYLITEVEDSALRRHHMAGRTLLIVGLMWGLMALGILDVVVASLAAALALIMAGAMPVGEARHVVDRASVVVFAASFGLAQAVVGSGVAEAWAQLFIGFSPLIALALFYAWISVLTCLIPAYLTVALAFPVALVLAPALGLPLPILVGTVATAAALAFLGRRALFSPTLLGRAEAPGPRDRLKLGLPLQVLGGVIAVAYFWGVGGLT